MDEEKLNNLIDKKLLEAKLEMHEKRMNYFIIIAGILISVFGVIVPLIQSSFSANKIDKAIQEMKNDFNKNYDITSKQNERATEQSISQLKELKTDFMTLANEQQNNLSENNNKLNDKIKEYEEKVTKLTNDSFRKPKLISYFEGRDLSSQTLKFSRDIRSTILIKNIGDAPARNIKIFVYYKSDSQIDIYGGNPDNRISDETNFNLVADISQGNVFSLAPDESYSFDLPISYDGKLNVIIPALLKIYYDQPEPMKCYFYCNLDYTSSRQ